MAADAGLLHRLRGQDALVPLHGWLPDAHSQAPTAGSVDLAGILLKTAAYGLLRFTLPLFPEASAEFALYAMLPRPHRHRLRRLLAFAQTDIKRLVALHQHLPHGLL